MNPIARPLRALMLWLLLAPLLALAQSLQPVPELRARVMDQTGTLDAGTLATLESRLASFEQEHGAQVVVLMVASTAPEDIAAQGHGRCRNGGRRRALG